MKCTNQYQLFVLTGCQIFQLQCNKFNLDWGSAQTPLGSLQCSPDPITGGEGAGCPLPKNTIPALCILGLDRRCAVLKFF